MSFLFSILEGAFSLWGWFKGNKDQQTGRAVQKADDLKSSLDLQQRETKAGIDAPQNTQELENKLKEGDF